MNRIFLLSPAHCGGLRARMILRPQADFDLARRLRGEGAPLKAFGARLRFPRDFVARGDMSRGGLLLRRAADREELEHIPVRGAALHGKRPPKLPPRRYSR